MFRLNDIATLYNKTYRQMAGSLTGNEASKSQILHNFLIKSREKLNYQARNYDYGIFILQAE